MDIRQLRYFVTVAKKLSISEASRDHHLTQSALSRQIQKLEDQLGCKLFDRQSSRLVLTEKGKIFLPEAIQIVEQWDRALILLKNNKLSRSNTVRVGFMPFAMLSFLPGLLAFLKQTMPTVDLQLQEYYTQTSVIDALMNDEVDLIFHNPPFEHSSYFTETVYKEEIIVILPEGHKLSGRSIIQPEDLIGERYILPNEDVNPILLERFRLFAIENEFVPNVVHRTGPHQARLSLVAAGQGITLDGKSVENLNMPRVVYKRLDASLRAFVQVAVSWPGNKEPSIGQVLLQYFKHLVHQPVES